MSYTVNTCMLSVAMFHTVNTCLLALSVAVSHTVNTCMFSLSVAVSHTVYTLVAGSPVSSVCSSAYECGARMYCVGPLGNQTCQCDTDYILRLNGFCGTYSGSVVTGMGSAVRILTVSSLERVLRYVFWQCRHWNGFCGTYSGNVVTGTGSGASLD